MGCRSVQPIRNSRPWRLSFGRKQISLGTMSALATTAVVPLVTDSHGGIRVRGTRVALDRIVVAFKSGATAEEIAQQFPTVELRDVYLVIGHYLSYTNEIDAYLSQRQSEAAGIQRDIEKKFNPVGIRARLLARQRAKPAG
jgi:uncharacterized protein (DUF433 family)